jgi:hypothetical protein
MLILLIALSVYFSLTVFILPEKYLAKETFTPKPYLEVELSASEISLGKSFSLNVLSENKGDYGDIHIVSVAFPTEQNIKDIVKITSYDFNKSPLFIKPGDKIGTKYSGGLFKTIASYPSIEAINRPVLAGSRYIVDLEITPDKTGVFTIYVKTIDIPHSSQLSHYPLRGKLDPQDEYVLVYSVNVNP